jgi:hypothetical protein
MARFPCLQYSALVLARRKAELLTCLDKRLHRVIVRGRIRAVHEGLDTPLSILTTFTKLLNQFMVLQLTRRRRLHKLLQQFCRRLRLFNTRCQFHRRRQHKISLLAMRVRSWHLRMSTMLAPKPAILS